MSDPKRYTPMMVCVEPSYQAQEVVSPMAKTVKGGEWVKWEDYARLKAEVERLKTELADEKSANASVEGRQNSANRGLSMRNHLLQAEVERLRKAGDAMAKTIGENGVHDNGSFHDVADSIDRWNAAKEGKQL